jgi:NADPH:quinone reductase
LVQLARNASARVAALASSERKLATARALGADVTVNYSNQDWPLRAREAAGEADVVFDGVGGDVGLAAFALLRRGGRFCPFGMASGSFAPVSPELAREHQVTVLRSRPLGAEELRRMTEAALAEAAAGRIHPVIGQEFELAQAAAAHAAIESRITTGKTLLRISR